MENFKKALKQAILDKAEAVRFEEAQKPQLLMFGAERPVAPLPDQSRAEILQLIESLLPMNPPTNVQVREGVLSIVNFGELKLLASTGDIARLFAFIPPQGNQLYQQIKNQLLSNTLKPAPKPLNMPSEETSPFAQPEQPGHFSMGTVTGHGTADNLQPAATGKVEEQPIPLMQAAPSPGLSVPPIPPRDAAGTLVRPRFDKPIPVDFTGDAAAPASTETKATKVEDPQQNTIISATEVEKITTPSPAGFQKDEYTDAEDYHFNQSIHSMSRPASEFTKTYAALHMPASASSMPAALERKAPAPLEEGVVIHFGPTAPGESIERSGRLPIDALLEEMVGRRASDLHLSLAEQACMRIDGDIVRMGEAVLKEEQLRSYILPIMPPKNREEFARVSDTDFAYEVPGLARFRVNIFRNRLGVAAVLRQIPDKILTADDLSLSPAIRKFCELRKGLVVVTGPTGSGKSTTLAAMVDLINESRNEHILTIEDPIEFVHRQKRCLVNQREVFQHTQSFSRALRAALREDPDIIMIGEMRDLETVETAIETAETGHLVFGTLHTNTAISTVDRLIDQFPAGQHEQVRVMLAESLKGVVAQTLVKKKGGGRVAAYEILVVDKAVSSLIREGNTHMVQNHMQTQKAKGNCTLNDALMTLVSKGIVDARDAYSSAVEKDAFANMLQQKGIAVDPSIKSA